MPSAPDIDLHPYFRDPGKAKAILDIAIADNISKNINLIRVVHGKGKGNFRQLVHSYLEKHPDVEGFTLCDPFHGGDGATWVHLKIKAELTNGKIETPSERKRPLSWLVIIFWTLILVLMVAWFLGARN